MAVEGHSGEMDIKAPNCLCLDSNETSAENCISMTLLMPCSMRTRPWRDKHVGHNPLPPLRQAPGLDMG